MRTNNSRVNRRFQAGVTLIELSLALIVAAIVAGVAIGLYGTGSDAAKTSNAQTQLMTVVGNTKKLAQGGLYTGITTHVVAQSGGIPESLLDKTTATDWKIVNAYGGNYTIATTTPFTTATITMDKVSTAGCTDLVTNTQANFYAVKVGSVDLKTAGGTNATSAAITTECAKTAANTVVFTVTS